jgi:hypothetical protein
LALRMAQPGARDERQTEIETIGTASGHGEDS